MVCGCVSGRPARSGFTGHSESFKVRFWRTVQPDDCAPNFALCVLTRKCHVPSIPNSKVCTGHRPIAPQCFLGLQAIVSRKGNGIRQEEDLWWKQNDDYVPREGTENLLEFVRKVSCHARVVDITQLPLTHAPRANVSALSNPKIYTM